MALFAADALELLSRAHAQDRLAHAYLITGPQGSGKRQLATDLAALILGTPEPLKHPDAHILEPESRSRRIRVESIRELERELQMRSSRGGKKVGILFDADRLQEQAANAFLKTLEEPPAHSHLFLVSSLPDQLLETILSRCIEVSIQLPERLAATPLETELLNQLSEFSQQPRPDLSQVFLLVRRFQELLGKARQAIQEENEKALKKEEPLYKYAPNKDALEEREDYFKALTESRYIGERSRLLAILEQWWADVLRQNACPGSTPELDQPEFEKATAALATRFSPAEILKKISALEKMRQNLGRNIQEQLAIEIGFLDAFEAPGKS
ncbi:MAG: dna polymerase iii delta subunit [Chthoniobacteraceae bacterium]|nr:dna polymerase iii delta subunit [Chthoniobacteraceae bacterium]MDB6173014.1 dna polymerase iii delta subunit [Chthoniobacteraceae bacterium]